MNTPLIEFRNLCKRFDDNVVLDGVNLTFNQGEVTTIIGKSGVGKSVMIKHIVGLLEPDSGEILVRGQPLGEMSKADRKEFKGRVSYMFQSNALFDSMTVFDNVALPLRERRLLPESKIREKAMALLRTLELPHVTDRYPSQLSGGMQKRVALARALVSDPEVVLFDEPTTGLDPLRKNAVLAMVSQYQRHFGFTAIMVSHDVPDVFYISNRIAILDKGKILFAGSPVELERSGNEVAVEFLASLESLENEVMGITGLHGLEARLTEAGGGTGRQAALLSLEDMAGLRAQAGNLGAHRVLDACIALARKHAGPDALLGRVGPGEFLCVLANGGADVARNFLAGLTRDLADGAVLCRLGAAGLTVSVGVLGGAAVLGADGCRAAVSEARAGAKAIGRLECGDGE